MSSEPAESEGLLELQERVYPTKPPTYEDEESMILLDVVFRFWKDWNCPERSVRYAFSSNMTLDEVIEATEEKNPEYVPVGTKYVFCHVESSEIAPAGKLIAVGDTLAKIKYLCERKDRIVITNASDHPERLLRAQDRRGKIALSIITLVLFVLMGGFILLISMTT